MFIGSTLGRIAVTRARAEAVITQLDSRLKNSERELRTGAADRDRTAALTDECASAAGWDCPRGWGADYFPNFGAGGGKLRHTRDLLPQVELAAGAEVAERTILLVRRLADITTSLRPSRPGRRRERSWIAPTPSAARAWSGQNSHRRCLQF